MHFYALRQSSWDFLNSLTLIWRQLEFPDIVCQFSLIVSHHIGISDCHLENLCGHKIPPKPIPTHDNCKKFCLSFALSDVYENFCLTVFNKSSDRSFLMLWYPTNGLTAPIFRNFYSTKCHSVKMVTLDCYYSINVALRSTHWELGKEQNQKWEFQVSRQSTSITNCIDTG